LIKNATKRSIHLLQRSVLLLKRNVNQITQITQILRVKKNWFSDKPGPADIMELLLLRGEFQFAPTGQGLPPGDPNFTPPVQASQYPRPFSHSFPGRLPQVFKKNKKKFFH